MIEFRSMVSVVEGFRWALLGTATAPGPIMIMSTLRRQQPLTKRMSPISDFLYSMAMTQFKTILQISTRDQRGGAERIANTLFQKYHARGHQSWLLVGKQYNRQANTWELRHAPAADNPWSRTLLKLIEALSPLRQHGVRGVAAVQSHLRLLAQPTAWYNRRQGYEDFAFPGTWDLLQQLPAMPDIIHCHNLHGDYFDLRVLPWLSRQRPVILHLHDSWLLSGHCAQPLDCRRWQTGCGACPYLEIYPAIARDQSAANWQRKAAIYAQSRLYIVAVSQWLMDQVQQSMLAGMQQRVIHNGIDLQLFHPGDQQAARRALGLPPQARIILHTAAGTFKDSATMNAALAQLTGEELLFLCVGETLYVGESGRVERLGNGRSIKRRYVGDPAEMARYYRAADLYLHSAKADSFPTTILEAMACGTPVVATAVGGIPEQIRDGETGLLVPPQAPQAMAHALQTLLADRELRQCMGEAAAAHAKQRFGLARQVDALLTYYAEVLEDWQTNQPAGQSIGQIVPARQPIDDQYSSVNEM